MNTDKQQQFNEEYPRFICAANLNPDGLFWSIWDRLNSRSITTGFEHRIVRPYCDHLNQTWGAQQSPQFNEFEPKA
jgi:hypothetical protein